MVATEDPKALMWRITEETWNNGRLELVDELIAEGLVDHVELEGLKGNGRARYRASIEPRSGAKLQWCVTELVLPRCERRFPSRSWTARPWPSVCHDRDG
jgi:hypothetical protein